MRFQLGSALGIVGFASAIAVACGGNVSLGDLGSGDAGLDSGDGGSSGGPPPVKECSSPSACGPAPKSPAIQCSDGSLGGNTGRCIQAKDGSCVWEIRECAPDPCFDAAGVLSPTYKKCSVPSDCVVVEYARDCCGTLLAAGVASSAETKVKQCAADRAASLPKCGCPTGPTVADDGSNAGAGGVSPAVTCSAAGLCETTFKGAVCGTTTCTSAESCCSGIPLPAPKCFSSACPVSLRKYKKDISYLSYEDMQRLNDELLAFPLATYRYKSESATDRKQLGFIIDDVAPSSAVMASGERVDMYGYQTMAVAALQVQARQIAELRLELEELKRTCAPSRR